MHKIFMILVWTNILLMFVQLPSLTYIICFGENGHVLIEPMKERKCCGAGKQHEVGNGFLNDSVETDSVESQSSHCGECIDIVFSVDYFFKHNLLKFPTQNEDHVKTIVSFLVIEQADFPLINFNTKSIHKTIKSPPTIHSLTGTTILRI